MADRAKQQEQITKAELLQDLLLDHWIKMAENNALTSTDAATIARLLSSNGWVLDPSALPKDLRDKLTSDIAFDDELDGEAKPRLVG